MDLMKDFVNEETITFKIDEREFAYKPVTSEQENEWLKEYMRVNEYGEAYQDLSQLNKCKLRNITKVPYTKEIIKKIINVDKEWDGLSKEERFKLLGKLKPTLFTNIIRKINSIDKGDDLKNS